MTFDEIFDLTARVCCVLSSTSRQSVLSTQRHQYTQTPCWFFILEKYKFCGVSSFYYIPGRIGQHECSVCTLHVFPLHRPSIFVVFSSRCSNVESRNHGGLVNRAGRACSKQHGRDQPPCRTTCRVSPDVAPLTHPRLLRCVAKL